MSINPDKKKGKLPQFGKLNAVRPLPEPTSGGALDAPKGMKRSTKVVLAMAGTAAIVTYMATREPVCKPANPNDWNAPANPQPCRQSSRSGGSWYWSSGSSSTSSTTAKSTSSSTQGVVSRGGFGATGSSISGHGGS